MQVHIEILRNIARNLPAAFGSWRNRLLQIGVPADKLDSPDAMLPHSVGIALWQSIYDQTQDRAIALRIGGQVNLSILGWIAPLAQASPTLGDAWARIVQFYRLMGDMFAYDLMPIADGGMAFVFQPAAQWVAQSPLTAALATEHAMRGHLAISGYLAGVPVVPKRVRLAYAPVPEEHLHASFLGTSAIEFNATESTLEFSAETASQVVVSANPVVYSAMLDYCRQQLAAHAPETDIAAQVRQVLQQQQHFYAPTAAQVAQSMGMSLRTLQRRLGEQGVSFQQILAEHRLDVATGLLAQPALPIKEIAFVLGFGSQDAFSRAFRRRTGVSPTAFRTLEFIKSNHRQERYPLQHLR